MLKKYILTLTLTLLTIIGFSQPVYKYVKSDNVPVIKNGKTLLDPWAGGLNNPQFNEIDVNLDCVLDLVILDRDGSLLKVYVNDNKPDTVSYHYAPEFEKYFPSDINDILIIRDYDHDGRPDIFTNNTPYKFSGNGLKVYRNVSDTTLKFELVTEFLPADYFGWPSTVLVKAFDFPSIEDIDGDGDYDIVAAHQTYLSYQYYENVSPNHDSIAYAYREACWGSFFQNNDGTVMFDLQCKGGGGNDTTSSVSRHGGAAITTIDLNGDNVMDCLLGDPDRANMISIMNNGTPTDAHMVSAQYDFPTNATPISLTSFPASFIVDIDNAGKPEMILASNQFEGGIDTGNVFVYHDISTTSTPDFQKGTERFLIGEQLDFGTNAIPTLGDISGDGIPDLLVGNLGYFESYDENWFTTEYKSQIGYYKNVGTASQPSFEFVTEDLSNISTKGFDRVSPTLIDIDNDGDNDLFFGESHGTINYYENTASIGSEANFVLVTNNFMGQNFGVQASPYFYDVDGDGLYDLLVGQKNGHIKLFLNQGSLTSPLYTTSATDTLGGVYNYNPGFESNAVPYISNVNGGQNSILVVGDGFGNLLFYDGLDTDYMGTFTRIDSLKVSNAPINITGADLTNNNSTEFIIGERTGGITYLHIDSNAFDSIPFLNTPCDTTSDTTSVWEIQSKNSSFGIYPNPNNGNFTVKLFKSYNGEGMLSILDLSGKEVMIQNLNLNANKFEIPVYSQNLKQGVYIVQIILEGETLRSRLVIQ